MPRYKVTLEYAGTRYSGWQKQKNARTVQGEVERAIAEVSGEKAFEFQGSGRTDAGVHALMQVAHLELRKSLPTETLRRGINDELPADINVLAIDIAPKRFHARHSAVGRTYLYQIARRRSAFAKPFVWWVKESIDVAKMRDAAGRFQGMHDFRSFSDDDPDEKSTDVLIEELLIEEDGDLVLIRVGGSHFIWKMVRRMVGVLAEIGRGKMPAAEVDALLSARSHSTRDQEASLGHSLRAGEQVARLTAPASGLFLEHVRYDGDPPVTPLRAAFPVPLAGG